jgi:hypothetical protein
LLLTSKGPEETGQTLTCLLSFLQNSNLKSWLV